MSDSVKVELESLRRLRTGVAAYSKALRQAGESAVNDAGRAEQRLAGVVNRQRAEAHRAQIELQRARSAAAAAPPERSRESAAAVRTAEAAFANASRALERSRAAHRSAADASSTLANTVRQAMAAVEQHSSFSASILSDLDERIGALVAQRRRDVASDTLRHGIATAGIAAEIAVAGTGLAQLAGNVTQGAVPTGDRIDSTSEMTEWRTEREQQNYADYELRRREERSGEVGQEEST